MTGVGSGLANCCSGSVCRRTWLRALVHRRFRLSMRLLVWLGWIVVVGERFCLRWLFCPERTRRIVFGAMIGATLGSSAPLGVGGQVAVISVLARWVTTMIVAFAGSSSLLSYLERVKFLVFMRGWRVRMRLLAMPVVWRAGYVSALGRRSWFGASSGVEGCCHVGRTGVSVGGFV